MLTIISPFHSASQARGSAALEALMLVVFLIVPMWMLLFNMGYAGVRLQQAQVSMRLAAHEVVKRNTEGENAAAAAQAIANQVDAYVFPEEENVVGLTVSEVSVSGELGADNNGLFDLLGGMLASLSGNSRLQINVSRTSPFELFESSDIQVPLTVGGTPFVYCEIENADFNPFDGENVGLGILGMITGASNVILAPFGGLPTGNDKC